MATGPIRLNGAENYATANFDRHAAPSVGQVTVGAPPDAPDTGRLNVNRWSSNTAHCTRHTVVDYLDYIAELRELKRPSEKPPIVVI